MDLIDDLGCKNNSVTAECSKKAMFIDSHTLNSKNERHFGRDAKFYLLCQDIRCRQVRWNEQQLYYHDKKMSTFDKNIYNYCIVAHSKHLFYTN